VNSALAVHVRQLVASAAVKYRPLSVLFEITHRCHLACVHCYLDDNHQWHDKTRELTTQEAMDAITQLRAAGCMFMTLSGGETFLRPDLFALLRHARSLGLAVTLFTTGTLLREKHLPELARMYLRCVELSLYSTDPAVHDAITQQPGSQQKTLQAVETLLAHGIPVAIKCPLMRSNAASYPGLKALAERLNIRLTVDPTLAVTNAGQLAPVQMRLTPEQLTEFYSRPEFRSTSAQPVADPDSPICAIGKRSCVIGPFGDIYTCLGYQRSLGNLRQQSFQEIWSDTGQLHRLRRLRVADLPVCGSCQKSGYCGRCAGSALLEEGNFNAPSSNACQNASARDAAAGRTPTPSAAERLQPQTSAQPRRHLPVLG
jgi:radical SAM protein with 4Fe4S-binding SPASM domain